MDFGGMGDEKRLDLGFILQVDPTDLLMDLTHRDGKEESKMAPRFLP